EGDEPSPTGSTSQERFLRRRSCPLVGPGTLTNVTDTRRSVIGCPPQGASMTKRLRLGLWALALFTSATFSCSRSDTGARSSTAATSAAPSLQAPTQPNYFAGPPDESQSVVQRLPRVEVAYPSLSAPFRDIPAAAPSGERFEREPRRSPFPFPAATQPDPV